jgi:hypothetical protein
MYPLALRFRPGFEETQPTDKSDACFSMNPLQRVFYNWSRRFQSEATGMIYFYLPRSRLPSVMPMTSHDDTLVVLSSSQESAPYAAAIRTSYLVGC